MWNCCNQGYKDDIMEGYFIFLKIKGVFSQQIGNNMQIEKNKCKIYGSPCSDLFIQNSLLPLSNKFFSVYPFSNVISNAII